MEDEVDINQVVKHRLLAEKRFFLNKSNTKWISIGILPGYEKLNGTGFVPEVRIGGDGGKMLSLGQPALVGLNSLISILRSSSNEQSTGIVINQFVMGNSICYKLMRNDQSVCIGYQSIEGLLEMEEFLKAYLNNLKVKEIEEYFLSFLEDEGDKTGEIVQSGENGIDLHTNFADFVQLCLEIKNSSTSLNPLNEENSLTSLIPSKDIDTSNDAEPAPKRPCKNRNSK